MARLYRLTLAALVAASLIFHLAVLWESRKQIAAGYGDFIIFYTGAQIVKDGKGKELFNVETQNAYQAKFDVPKLDWPLPFNHAPYELLLFLPLAHFSYPLAHAIWSGLNLIFLAIMLSWLLPYAHSNHKFFIGASLLAWFPTMEAFRLGQDSILSTVLLVAVFAALKQKRDGWAGGLLALGLYKPQLVLPLAGVFLAAQRWRSLAVFGVTGVILATVSFAMVGWQGVLDLVSILRSMGNYDFIVRPALMPNLRGLIHVVFLRGNLEWLTGDVAILISFGLYSLCLYIWRQDVDVLESRFDLAFALVLVTTVLISYHLYVHDLFIITISIVLFFRFVSSETRIDRATTNIFFLLLLVLFFPVVPRYLFMSREFGWVALPILLFHTILIVEIVRCRCKLQASLDIIRD